MKKVIVLGSLNMDLSILCDELPKIGETINGYDFLATPGGKGGNQAVAASKLGANTYMIGNVGKDIFGDQLVYSLKESGINTEYICVDSDTSSGVAVIICNNNDNRIILGNGANYSLNKEYVQKSLDEISTKGDIFLTQLENKYDLVKESIVHAKRNGMFTILNPAPAVECLDDLLYENLDLIILNQTECQLLSGVYPQEQEDLYKAFEFFAKKGVEVIITLGESGSVYMKDSKLENIPARKVKVVDTTGAGDSYIGALCAELAEGSELGEALKFATDVAAVCVTRRGAQVSIPNKKEVKDIYKEEK